MADQVATNITWHEGEVTAEQRKENMGQQGATLWLTGLSGSGKSTVAVALEKLESAQVVELARAAKEKRANLECDLFASAKLIPKKN